MKPEQTVPHPAQPGSPSNDDVFRPAGSREPVERDTIKPAGKRRGKR